MPANKQITRAAVGTRGKGQEAGAERRGSMSHCPCVTRSKYQLAKATAYEPNDKPEPKYTHKYVHNVLVDMLQALAKGAHPSCFCAPV